MFCDECRDFSDVFSETTEVIHRQVEHQIRFHSLPRESGGDDGPRPDLISHRPATKSSSHQQDINALLADAQITHPAGWPSTADSDGVEPALRLGEQLGALDDAHFLGP